MNKSKKKKNYKLRRQVKRTVASITMVMAVTVAAIPVENLGTVQATSENIYQTLTGRYGEYENSLVSLYEKEKENNDFEAAYNQPEIKIQRIENGYMTEAFMAKPNVQQDAMITKYLGGDADDFVINEKEYYDYVVMDEAYFTAFDTALADEKYTMNYGQSVTEIDAVVPNSINNSAETTYKLDGFDIITIDENSNSYKVSGVSQNRGGNFTYDGNKYVYIESLSGDGSELAEFIYDNCYNNIVGSAVRDYNDVVNEKMTKLTDIERRFTRTYQQHYDALLNGTDPSGFENDLTGIMNEWNDIKDDFTDGKLNDKSLEISTTYGDLITKIKSNELLTYTIHNYMVCNFAKVADGGTLKKFELDEIKLVDGVNVYVPKSSSGEHDKGQFIDVQGYLAAGQVTIKGIASYKDTDSEVFKGARITGKVTIPQSVRFIGVGAFEGCKLSEVEIYDANCTIIGDDCFRDCVNLERLTFKDDNSALETIGNHAFSNTLLQNIVIPENVTRIGMACFEDTELTTLTFSESKSGKLTVDPFAFYNSPKLSAVVWNDREAVLGCGAFALAEEHYVDNVLKDFVFPSGRKIMDVDVTVDEMKDADGEGRKKQDDYDYILAGRTRLETVTLPDALASWIPDNTFAGCINLGKVLAPENAGAAYYDPSKLFSTVLNDDIYVEGPEYYPPESENPNSKATVRITTWEAQNANGKAVPYKFYRDGVECWEYGVIDEKTDKAFFVGTISLPNGANGDVVLEGFVTNPAVVDDLASLPKQELKIGSVGGKAVTQVGGGTRSVLSDDMKDKIYKITIQDGTVKLISDNAFTGSTALEWVEIGNAIESIGSNAFSDCTVLENIDFNYDPIMYELEPEDEAWTKLVVAGDAFDTQSDFLTFHGPVNSNYAPFKYAMKKGDYESVGDVTASGREICYKADAPLNLTIIRDKATKLATLVDYPHYSEMSLFNEALETELGYNIKDKFESLYGINGAQLINTVNAPEDAEIDSRILNIVKQILYLNVPDGIESIDTVAYFKDNVELNTVNFDYINRAYRQIYDGKDKDGNDIAVDYEPYYIDRLIDETGNNVKKLYSDKDYKSDDILKIAGLFNGFFVESGEKILGSTYNNYTYRQEAELNTENASKAGNDILTEVTLKSVQKLPDYAFYNCENLTGFNTSENLISFGKLPFKACKSMKNVTPAETEYYSYNNLLLFEKAGGGLRLIECFEGRGGVGGGYGASAIAASELAGVYELADAAFSNCENLTKIELDQSTISIVPQDCFRNCSSLNQLVLPESVIEIKADSLVELGSDLEITVPNPFCYINTRAFDGNTNVQFWGVKYIDETNGVESPCYKAFKQLEEYYGDVIHGDEQDDKEGKFRFNNLGNTYRVEFVDADLKTIKVVSVDTGAGQTEVPAEEVPTAPARDGYDFKEWICKVGDTVYTGADTYRNLKEDRMVIATYVPNPKVVVSDGQNYKLTVTKGKALIDGQIVTSFPVEILGGTNVTLMADDNDAFRVWTTQPGEYINLVDNASSYTTNFTMPNADVEVIANNTDTPNEDEGGDDNNDDDNNGDDNNDDNNNNDNNGDDDNNNGQQGGNSETKYKLTVNYGAGSGEYKAGETVTISAFAPETSNKVFSKWTTNHSGLGFASAASATTTIVMPAADVTVTANYKVRLEEDDDDDDENTRRPTTNTTVVTPPSTDSGNTSTGTTTGTVTKPSGTVSSGDDRIYITKNGVSNKDVASVSVTGSTDNFIVKITESSEATSDAEQALKSHYGTLEGLSYLPMDIALYDASGQNKITDTHGLNITITMPIPDVLIQYGGNARVAAVRDGYLHQITPRFTTIDGIACISFVPPYFSSYVIYVDTNNLIAGQMIDSTPATGDPIHPKWFLAIGMACISIILFATSDSGRKRRSFKTA